MFLSFLISIFRKLVYVNASLVNTSQMSEEDVEISVLPPFHIR